MNIGWSILPLCQLHSLTMFTSKEIKSTTTAAVSVYIHNHERQERHKVHQNAQALHVKRLTLI